ncbi:hypothetical protein FJTKL_06973 [Diaporthe vaccinii]|uniref:VWFA domain-containing protein n=1 Tax=Diaporthe vaccinii TaxID=105482 RepID=A0ABR4DRW1_9PEZI
MGFGYLWDKFESSIPNLLVNVKNDGKIKVLLPGKCFELMGPEKISKLTEESITILTRLNSWSRIDIDVDSFSALCQHAGLMPYFLQFLIGMGRKFSSKDEDFMACYSTFPSDSGLVGDVRSETDTSGDACWALCYNIRLKSEAPPAYTSVPTAGAITYAAALPTAHAARNPSPTPSNFSAIAVATPEDQYAFLSSFDTVFLIDHSGSMVGRSWREVQSALSSITPICTAHDADSIDIYFLNHRSPYATGGSKGKAMYGYINVKHAAAVDDIFTSVRPCGMTPTGTRLNDILKAYLRHYEAAVERAGGVPSDDPESVLLFVAQKLDQLESPPHQIGVQFFQVGNEPGAARALRTLDDDLAKMGGGVRDIWSDTALQMTSFKWICL